MNKDVSAVAARSHVSFAAMLQNTDPTVGLQVPVVTTAASTSNKPASVPSDQDRWTEWTPIPGKPPGTAYHAFDQSAGHPVELRLLPWIDDPQSVASLRKQCKLVSLLAKNGRRILDLDSESTPVRVVLECQGDSLSATFESLDHKTRVSAAAAIWQAASIALDGGLYHGALQLDDIYVTQGNPGQTVVDFLGRFYRPETFQVEPRFEDECARLIEVVCDVLRPLTEGDIPPGILSGRVGGQLRSLVRQKIEHGQELAAYERWSNFFQKVQQSFPSLQANQTEEVNPSHHSLDALSDESSPELLGATAEVQVDPLLDNSGLADDQTGEVNITPMITKRGLGAFVECGDLIGRFRVDSLLGQGGMGVVYRGTDLSTDEPVAIKILRPNGKDAVQAARRFKKEARLLAGVQNEYVTQLVETGCDKKLHYLVMEYVPGINLSEWLQQRETVDERSALQITADVARALVDAHRQEIIHRDIKPENVLLGRRHPEDDADASSDLSQFRIKLSDFGIARAIDQSASMEVTRAGTLLGTPTYMSPEQCRGNGTVVPASDIYSLGVTLYAMLAGEPPFQADDPMKLAALHCFEPPVPIERRNRGISERTGDLLSRMLAKEPERRPADAEQLVREIDQLLQGDPGNFELHPQVPESSARRVWERVFEWEFDSTPEELWPFVSNTERLNRAAGLHAVEYRTEKSDGTQPKKIGSFKLAGMRIEWEEHPFEWIEGKRMGVLREFATGPFCWFSSVVELDRKANEKTRLTHTVRIEPRNLAGWGIASLEAGWKGGRALDRIYRRIDESIQYHKEDPLFDPFEPPTKISSSVLARAEHRTENMTELGIAPDVAQQIQQFVLNASPQSLARIKPMELAESLHLTLEECLDACLVAAHCGILQIRWDILCPTCRAPASNTRLLAEIDSHTDCEACDTEFASNIASAIELVFQAHPEIRTIDDQLYCVGGPEHSPHVVSQIRMAPEEKLELSLRLDVGDYLLRLPGRIQSQPLRVRPSSAPSILDQKLSCLGETSHTPVLRAGQVTIALTNDLGNPCAVRLERSVMRDNVVTADMASSATRFRALFPDQVFDREKSIAAEDLTLLAARIVNVDLLYNTLGDAAAYQQIQQTLEEIEQTVTRHSGAVIKSVGETLLTSFRDSAQAVRAAIELQQTSSRGALPSGSVAVFAIHRGPLLVTTQNGRLDYFGTTARRINMLVERFDSGVVLSESIFSDPVTQGILAKQTSLPFTTEVLDLSLPGSTHQIVQHLDQERKDNE